MYRKKLGEKLNESLKAVLPIVAIILLLSLTIAPIPSGTLLVFLFGSVLLILGMMFFTLGAELAMETMGERLGAGITKTKKLWLILLLAFILGFMITVSEPDLQVLAKQVASIPDRVLIFSVAAGVGLFLMLAFLRMLIGIPLRTMLWGAYGLVFVLLFFAPENFIAAAFDSGGVTTGPMTVPFIMAFGIGIASTRNDRHAADDSFGLIALSSVGPILAVLLLGLIYQPDRVTYAAALLPEVSVSVELSRFFLRQMPIYVKEIATALLPILIFFLLFQLIRLKLNRKILIRILIGAVYTYVGLILFLTGVNAGFLPVGAGLGEILGSLPYRWIVIPLGMLIGYFIVKAEPAVYVLMDQVEELTNGAIGGRTLQRSLSFSVAFSVGLAMLRVLLGISILWFIVPGYLVALALSLFSPKIFTAIAFDSGGVASGPMTATFLLPLAMGVCQAVGGNIVTDAFGVVAMVAMTPLLAIQILGCLYSFGERKTTFSSETEIPAGHAGDYEIIEL